MKPALGLACSVSSAVSVCVQPESRLPLARDGIVGLLPAIVDLRN